ncbi:PfkB family carbohydrate kinase [Streptomyces sp. HNM1019]|uniref:sugar kinase n=1 Tax=Streptomyces sp. HNM1019 TaxID=3424717 RepID=UPI003D77A823
MSPLSSAEAAEGVADADDVVGDVVGDVVDADVIADGVDVVCLGESMVTFVPSRPGRLADVPSFARGIGGAESNVACGLARAGHSARWISRVGTDGFGEHLVREIAATGVDTAYVQRDPYRPTGIYFRTAGERAVGSETADRDGGAAPEPLAEVVYYRAGSAAAAMSPALIPRARAWSGRVLHLTGITPALSGDCRALMHELTACAPGRPLVSFDLNYRVSLWQKGEGEVEGAGADGETGPAVLLDLARRCDLVFVGEDEAAAVWGVRGPEAIRAALPEPEVLVVKQGGAGATAYARRSGDGADARGRGAAADARSSDHRADARRSGDGVDARRPGDDADDRRPGDDADDRRSGDGADAHRSGDGADVCRSGPDADARRSDGDADARRSGDDVHARCLGDRADDRRSDGGADARRPGHDTDARRPGDRADDITFEPAPHVDVVAPVGAGDAFAAGFLSGTLRGLPIAERLRHGHLMAAAALTVPGDLGTPPAREHADHLVALDATRWGTLRFGPGWTDLPSPAEKWAETAAVEVTDS